VIHTAFDEPVEKTGELLTVVLENTEEHEQA